MSECGAWAKGVPLIERLRTRNERTLFGVLQKADRQLAIAMCVWSARFSTAIRATAHFS